jgi:hypothetical protein
MDSSGNTYQAGRYAGTVDFDPSDGNGPEDTLVNQTSTLYSDSPDSKSFVAKYKTDGSFAWVRSLHGIAEAVTADRSGNVFVGGRFFGTSSIADRTLVSKGGSDAFLAKYNADGESLWALPDDTSTLNGATVNDGMYELAADANGSVFEKMISGNVNSPYVQSVVKTSSSGAVQWKRDFSTGNSITLVLQGNLKLDSLGNPVPAGAFQGTVDFDPSSRVRNLPETDKDYVAKFNNNGQLLWAMSIPMPSADVAFAAYAVTIGRDGSIYLGGYLDVYNPPNYIPTWVDLDPGVGVSQHLVSAYNGFVMKLSPTGAFVWSEVLDNTTGESRIDHLEIDSNDTLNVVGRFVETTVDLDPNDMETRLFTSVGSVYNQFIAKWRQA